MRLFSKRIHESVAFASVLGASLSLHVAWMANMIVYRSATVAQAFTLVPAIGPVSGLYLLTGTSFLFFFLVALLLSRGRDVSHWRSRLLWFFILSTCFFALLTMPALYQIGAQIE